MKQTAEKGGILGGNKSLEGLVILLQKLFVVRLDLMP